MPAILCSSHTVSKAYNINQISSFHAQWPTVFQGRDQWVCTYRTVTVKCVHCVNGISHAVALSLVDRLTQFIFRVEVTVTQLHPYYDSHEWTFHLQKTLARCSDSRRLGFTTRIIQIFFRFQEQPEHIRHLSFSYAHGNCSDSHGFCFVSSWLTINKCNEMFKPN